MFPKSTEHTLKTFAVLKHVILVFLVFPTIYLRVPARQQKTFHPVATDPEVNKPFPQLPACHHIF